MRQRKAFREPERPLTYPAAEHRDGLQQVLRSNVHDRPDVWYVLEDGSNVDGVVADLLAAVLSGIADLDGLRDPSVAKARLMNGDFSNPDSLHGMSSSRQPLPLVRVRLKSGVGAPG